MARGAAMVCEESVGSYVPLDADDQASMIHPCGKACLARAMNIGQSYSLLSG